LLGLVLVITLAAGGLAAFVSPPRWLSVIDGLAGGGRGVSKVASGVPFGAHGQRLDVWRPEGAAGKRLPVVIFYYGGGWVKGSRGAYAFAARAYAAHGFVVVVPDYRKVPTVRFPAFLQDAADAVRWTNDHVAEHGGDPNRIAVAGHSAGAYAAAMLALDPRWLGAVGLPREVIKASVGLSGPYDFYPWTSRRSRDAMQGVADPRMTQPIAFASAEAPPMLLVTSSADTVVRPRNADRLAARLRAVGGRVEYSNHQGLSHEEVVMALSKPFRDKAPVLAESVAFLRTTLR
jgi:acetyl esterase/lipase